jgi:hypothetical protein
MLVSDLQKALSIDKKEVQDVEEAVKHKTGTAPSLDAVVMPDTLRIHAFLESAIESGAVLTQHAGFHCRGEVGPLSEFPRAEDHGLGKPRSSRCHWTT